MDFARLHHFLAVCAAFAQTWAELLPLFPLFFFPTLKITNAAHRSAIVTASVTAGVCCSTQKYKWQEHTVVRNGADN